MRVCLKLLLDFHILLFNFFSNQIECVILSACYTLIQAEAMIPYIGCIIGMNNAVGDKASIEFSKGFYQALSSGKALDFAFKFGCNTILTAGISENLTPIFRKSDLFSGTLKTDSSPYQDSLDANERILILAANPKNAPQLRLDEEVREIYAVLKIAREKGQVVLEQRWAARFKDLKEALLEFKPTVIHFCGHGAENEGLIFENETGYAEIVNTQQISEYLKFFATQIKCVLLNTDYSQVQAQEIAKYIDYTIGFRSPLGDKDFISFSLGFYRALGAGYSFEQAYNFGIAELGDISEDKLPILNSSKLS